MPKRRSTSNIRNLVPAGSRQDILRISNSPIEVEVYSSTRGRENVEVVFSDNFNAVVSSGSGNSYNVCITEAEIEDGEQTYVCDCLDYRYRRGICRHINAVRDALGRIESQSENIDITALHTEVLPQLDLQEEQSRVNAEQNHEFIDDGYSLLELPDEDFNTVLSEATNKGLNYEYENVLNGSSSTFGIELEISEGDGDKIAKELKKLGLNGSGRVLRYHENEFLDKDKWKVTLDSSVSYEIVSPVLKDDPNTWKDIDTVCRVIKKNGGKVSLKCGGHVHVGVDVLDNAKYRWRRLKKLVSGFEKLIYRFSAGEFDEVRPNALSSYAMPIQNQLSTLSDRNINIEDDSGILGIQDVARKMTFKGRYQSVNFSNLLRGGSPPTVEFRTFNGSLNPAQIQQNVRIAVGIMESAKDAQIQNEISRKRGELLKNYVPDSEGHKMIRNFLDIVFPRKKDKMSILGAYGRSKWQQNI